MDYVKNKPFITYEPILNVSHYKGYTMVLARRNWIEDWINGYVIIKPNQKGYNHKGNYSETCDISCHGNITFDKYDNDKNRVIGFNTAYDDDFTNFPSMNIWKSDKWTTPKLFNECKKIINQLK